MSRVQSQIEIWNTAQEVERDGKKKYKWTIGLNAGEQAKKVVKVVFRLHESFKNPEVTVDKSDATGVFTSREFSGWGTFVVCVVVHWHPTARCRFGKTTEFSHMLSFAAAKTSSTFELTSVGTCTEISQAVQSTVGMIFAPLAIQVVTLSGEELLNISEGGDMTCWDVKRALGEKQSLLPGSEYKLVHGDANLTDEQRMRELDDHSSAFKLTAVVQQKPSFQEGLNLALIKAAETLDLARIKTLLSAGASAAFLHDPPGTWGSCDAKTALHVAIKSRPRAQGGYKTDVSDSAPWNAVVQTLIEANADVNAKQRYSDWRGCGSSSTAFEMILPAALQNAALLQTFLLAGANPNTESRREVHSMRSDGGSRHCVLHTAVSSGNLDIVKTLLEAMADPNATSTERISNERGYNRNMSETSLHIACKRGDVKACALLLEHRADPNAVRTDLINEDIPEEELIAQGSTMCDDPRDSDYVCPVRSIAVEETALHIALQNNQEALVTLLACTGADKCLPRKRGNISVSVEELCAEKGSLLAALSATWPLAATCQVFSDDELECVKAAIAGQPM